MVSIVLRKARAACSTAALAKEVPKDGLAIRPTMLRTDCKSIPQKKTQQETLDAEGLPVQWTWVMRFTLFPPKDNVIVAGGRRRHPLSSNPAAAVAFALVRFVD